MKKYIVHTCILFVLILSACNKPAKEVSTISTDPNFIAEGQVLYAQTCVACHNFTQDGIGPQLGGLTKEVSADWLRKFIKNPKAMIDDGDERATMLMDKFKTIMPTFTNYTDEQVDMIIAYINTKDTPDPKKSFVDPNALKNPIPEPIP